MVNSTDGARLRRPTGVTEGSLLRALLSIGTPTICTGLLHSAFNIVDMIFVGRLGPDALAAVAASGVIIFLLITLAIGISIGTLSMVSRFWGAGHYRLASLVLAQSIYLSALVSIFFCVTGWYSARSLLSMLGTRGEVLDLAVSYIRIICLGSGSIFITICFSSALRATGDAVTPFKVMFFAVLLNIGLDPLLIFGWAGFPAMGVSGSALATVVSRTLSMVILAALVLGRRAHFNLAGAFSSIRWRLIGQIVRIGFFCSLEMLLRSVFALVFIMIVAPFGTAALAAYGIGTRLRLMVMMPGIGLGYGSGVLVGQNLGAGRPARARRSVWLSLALYELLLVPVVAAFLLFPEAIVGIFNRAPGVLLIGRQFLVYIAISLPFTAFTVVLGKSLNGAGDTRGPMAITAISLVLLALPMAWAGSRLWGITGAWLAFPVASVFQGALITAWFRRGRWLTRPQLDIDHLLIGEAVSLE